MSAPVMLVVQAVAGFIAGWASRGLWINYRYARPWLRSATKALDEQDIVTAKRYRAFAGAVIVSLGGDKRFLKDPV